MATTQAKRKKKKTKPFPIKIPSGWNTTDEDEIKRRILRAETEPLNVTALDPVPYFGNYEVQSKGSRPYWVEIRSLDERINSCACADYNGNGLGTCKHIEKVILVLQKKGKRRFCQASREGSPKVEIYLDADQQVKVKWPSQTDGAIGGHHFLKDFFSASGNLISDAKTTVPVIMRLIHAAPEPVRNGIRLSRTIESSLDGLTDFGEKAKARDFFLADVTDGIYALDIAKLPLYDYQKQGMLHLAFLEKAILADEMGLGKTVQAIVAAELLRKLRGIRKVLVVAPTSLKAEWEEQIEKFTNHSSILVYGNKKERLHQYQQDAFFYLTNYEQVVRDREDIQRLIAPDIVILDEAQRIKNWRTKTAATIKQIQSPYAFALTGTPIENRIDDIYSIVQFLYPKLFGPLFRFNREFYHLDDNGKPIGYKNLHVLHGRLKPFLLRRLKRDVEDQLPPRTINTYFIQMSDEQRGRYEEYESTVAQLAAHGRKRPLREEEFKKLQASLASMRMLCDTAYILDKACRQCPKLQELETILEELLPDGQAKVIIFSEWERMLELVGKSLQSKGIAYAWHTGSVDQVKRRDEIHRFKEDPECRVFLSTDAGALGLNLQVANVVINLDLPWNPAKLEQRIARAWRKNQARTVQVINMVSEGTIEHRMLGVLKYKQRLASNVLDLGTVSEMDMPSGRKAFMDQLGKILNMPDFMGQHQEEGQGEGTGEGQGEGTGEGQRQSPASPQGNHPDPLKLFQQEAIARFKPRLHQLEVYQSPEGQQTIFAVMDGNIAHPSQQLQSIADDLALTSINLEVVDRAAFETIQRLCQAGVLSFCHDKAESLYQSQVATASKQDEQKKRLKAAQACMAPIERKERMASLLADGGFYEEALPPLADVFECSLRALAILTGRPTSDKDKVPIEVIQGELIPQKGLPGDAVPLAAQLRKTTSAIDKQAFEGIAQGVISIRQFVDNALGKLGLDLVA